MGRGRPVCLQVCVSAMLPGPAAGAGLRRKAGHGRAARKTNLALAGPGLSSSLCPSCCVVSGKPLPLASAPSLPCPHVRLLRASHLVCGTVPGPSCFNSLLLRRSFPGLPWASAAPGWQIGVTQELVKPALSGTQRSAAFTSEQQNPDEEKTPVCGQTKPG